MINTHIITHRKGWSTAAKCLSFKHKGVSLIPRTHTKEANHMLLIPVVGNQRKANYLRLNDWSSQST